MTETMLIPQSDNNERRGLSFDVNLLRAFQELIDNPEFRYVWERFRFAYEYRKQFSWLGESGMGDGQQSGLEYAVSQVLSLYGASVKNESRRVETETVELDEDFKQQLGQAVDKVTQSKERVARIKHSLSYNNIDVENISTRSLSEYVAQCIKHYSDRAALDLSIDPW